jgi:hypothetical protein
VGRKVPISLPGGVDAVFPEVPAEERQRISQRIYLGVRNGLYHDHLTSAGIALARDTKSRVLYEPPGVDGTIEIVLNPELPTSRIGQHFSAYVADLLADPRSHLRAAFLRRQAWVNGHPAAEAVADADSDE